MPAGDIIDDLVTASYPGYAAECNAYVIADDGAEGADWYLRGLDGFGGADIEGRDIDLSLSPGVRATTDRETAPLLALTVQVNAGSAGAAETALAELTTAWRSLTADTQLHLLIPGRGHVYMVGRPRSVRANRVNPAAGIFTAVASFLATDPTIYDGTP